ncbi:MAG: 1-deoxy-D-xylulose-5-phosphate reductoisomerase [Clostridiales bacterium]
MIKNISILGSTGSIGVQTIDVAQNLDIKVLGLTAHSNIDLLEKQAKLLKPKIVSIGDKNLEDELKRRLRNYNIEVLSGPEGLNVVASINEVNTVITSIVGIAGLIPTLEAIRCKKNVALANKETLVTAGYIVMNEAKKNNVRVFPIDSEHSAIYQCLLGNSKDNIRKIILTASGGPFRGKSIDELKTVDVSSALKHPNWSMGSKITIDSATLMNKGLEVIEAKWLFDIEIDLIDVIIHPQSIIHSMVEYNDGSIIAQMGSPDMRIPIQYALTYPQRAENNFSKLDLLKVKDLTFEKPDREVFPALDIAFNAMKAGGTMPAVMNAANEEAVGLFLKEKIEFTDITKIISNVMERHQVKENPVISDILDCDLWARESVKF